MPPPSQPSPLRTRSYAKLCDLEGRPPTELNRQRLRHVQQRARRILDYEVDQAVSHGVADELEEAIDEGWLRF